MANNRQIEPDSPLALKDMGRTLTVEQVLTQLEKIAKKADRLADLAHEVRANVQWLSTCLEVEDKWPNLFAKFEADRERAEREKNRKATAKLSRKLATQRIQ